MPTGVPIAIAMELIRTLPAMAFSRPPRSSGGGVIIVNRSRLRLALPLLIVVHRIQTRKNRPNSAAAPESTIATRLNRWRRR